MLITCFIFMGIMSTVNADELLILPSGYISGNDYLAKNESEKKFYIAGLTDGLLGSAIFANSADPVVALDNVDRLDECLTSKITNLKQLTAIVDKYLENNPERWASPMYILYRLSVAEVCSFK